MPGGPEKSLKFEPKKSTNTAPPPQTELRKEGPRPLVPTYLGAFGSPVYFHTQVVPVLLPVQLAVHNVEEVPDSDLLSGGQLHQGYPGRNVFIFRHPKGYYVTTGGPRKISAEEENKVYQDRLSHDEEAQE